LKKFLKEHDKNKDGKVTEKEMCKDTGLLKDLCKLGYAMSGEKTKRLN
jgi:hypothetical protein